MKYLQARVMVRYVALDGTTGYEALQVPAGANTALEDFGRYGVQAYAERVRNRHPIYPKLDNPHIVSVTIRGKCITQF